MFELKPLSPSAIPAALAKAERYRLLNEPDQSQSICEDVLRADPDNQPALVMLVLALTDEFAQHHGRSVSRAQDSVSRLTSEYDRHYYGGLVAERRARALLDNRVLAPAPLWSGLKTRWAPTNAPTPSARRTTTTRNCGGTHARAR